jgi:protein-tyrosine phosphatase
VNHLKLPIYDGIKFPILNYFEKSNNFINDNLKVGNVYIHCIAGVSRSPTITIAYLMY